jgi:hypothetical protein
MELEEANRIIREKHAQYERLRPDDGKWGPGGLVVPPIIAVLIFGPDFHEFGFKVVTIVGWFMSFIVFKMMKKTAYEETYGSPDFKEAIQVRSEFEEKGLNQEDSYLS